ncbi:MAG: hypothetical protein NW206_19780 [Hyphomonadaceae bacterium]|nr:hypothetical protein [Hyphomonadaceae bacterium]
MSAAPDTSHFEDDMAAMALVRDMTGTMRWTLKQIDTGSLRAPGIDVARKAMAQTLARLHGLGLVSADLGPAMPPDNVKMGGRDLITPRGRQALNIMRGLKP